jgi:hypothetical protein
MVEAANDRLRLKRKKGVEAVLRERAVPSFSVQWRAGNASRQPTKDRENFFRCFYLTRFAEVGLAARA